MFSKQEKIILAILACINFTHIVDFMILMPLGPMLMRKFNIDPHQFGLLVSSYTFSAGVSGFLASLFIDRFDRKKSLLFFYVGFAIGTVGCALSRSYEVLLITRSFTGVFGGVISSIVMSVVSDVISLERRGTAMGVIMGAFSVASVFGVPFSLYIANQYDWHAPFMFLALIALFISIGVALHLPAMKSHLNNGHKQNTDKFFAIKHILKTPNQLWALLFMFCVIFGQFSVIPFISPSFVANGGLAESELPLIYLFGGIVSLFASPMFGRLSDKFGHKKVFYWGATSSIIPIFLLTNIFTPMNSILLLLISSSFFLVMGGRMVPTMTIISSAATPQYRGSFMSVNSSVQQLSAALASYISGIVIVKNSSGQLENYNFIGYNAIFFTFLALYVVRKIAVVKE